MIIGKKNSRKKTNEWPLKTSHNYNPHYEDIKNDFIFSFFITLIQSKWVSKINITLTNNILFEFYKKNQYSYKLQKKAFKHFFVDYFQHGNILRQHNKTQLHLRETASWQNQNARTEPSNRQIYWLFRPKANSAEFLVQLP